MHQRIAEFPSKEFYRGKLITPDSVKNRSVSWTSNPCFPTIAFWDTDGKLMSGSGGGFGYSNQEEVEFITRDILSLFTYEYLRNTDVKVSIGIISFYKEQVSIILLLFAGIYWSVCISLLLQGETTAKGIGIRNGIGSIENQHQSCNG